MHGWLVICTMSIVFMTSHPRAVSRFSSWDTGTSLLHLASFCIPRSRLQSSILQHGERRFASSEAVPRV
jgi:hypothetical protein